MAINNPMHTGLKLQKNLLEVLLHFSNHRIALAADISEIFLRVEPQERDQPYHRFMWRESPQDPTVFFQFCRVVFGMRASPYLAGRALRAAGEKFHAQATPEAVKVLENDFYVDDLLTSSPSEESAVVIQNTYNT